MSKRNLLAGVLGVLLFVGFDSLTGSSSEASTPPDRLILEIDTSLTETSANFFVLELNDVTNGGAITVDFGEGSVFPMSGSTRQFVTYPAADDTYTVTVSNTDTSQRVSLAYTGFMIEAITEVTEFPYWITSYERSFMNAKNLTSVASLPAGVENLSSMFKGASSLNDPNISTFNTSQVTNMANMFEGATSLNQSLATDSVNGYWDTSNVTDMSGMFNGATSFNQDIDSWDVSSVERMRSMFSGATSFNQDLDSWQVQNVIDTRSMFSGSDFNGDISSWDTDSLLAMSGMFSDTPFNGTFGTDWDTSNVSDFSDVFRNAQSFNQSLANWNTTSATNMLQMFESARAFTGTGVSGWNVTGVENFISTFEDAQSFNGDVSSWNPSSATNMRWMFKSARLFDQDLSSWNVSEVESMKGMFDNTRDFQGTGLSSWQTDALSNLTNTFRNATSFDEDISSWDISGVTSLSSTFDGATSFNSPLNGWDVSNVTSLASTFSDATSFNQPLNQWQTDSLSTMSNVFSGATSFNQDLDNWNVSDVTSSSFVFSGATSFDGDLSTWSMPNNSSFSSMFLDATSFNQDVTAWDMRSASSLSSMFEGATSFNQDINRWDLDSVFIIANFLKGATSFAYCLPDWDVSSIASKTDAFANMGTGYSTGTNFAFENCSEVSFDFQDSSTQAITSYVQPGSGFRIPAPETPTRSGFSSLGWFDSAIDGFSFSRFPRAFPSDQQVYLQWASAPIAPTNLTATKGNAKVDLSWTAPTDDGNVAITKYVVSRTNPDTSVDYIDVGLVTSYQDTGLLNDSNYVYKVSAINTEVSDTTNYSDANFSTVVSATPENLPAVFSFSDVSKTTDDVGRTDSQTVTVTDDGGTISSVSVSTSDSSIVDVASSIIGSDITITYDYKAAGQVTITFTVTDSDGLAVSKTHTVTVADIPGAIRSLSATGSNQQIQLSWQAPLSDGNSSITGYKIEQSSDESSWTTVKANTGSSSLSYLVTGLENGVEYFYRVSAINSLGASQPLSLTSAVSAEAASSNASPGFFTPTAVKPTLIIESPIEIDSETKTFSLRGSNLSNLSEALIAGVLTEVISISEDVVELAVPKLESGEHDLVLIFDDVDELDFEGVVKVVASKSRQKVNAGSFKGYVAIYSLGHEGQRLSTKVGKDWRVIDPIPAAKNNLFRLVEQVGAGFDIKLRIYIDRVLLREIEMTTR